MIYTKHTLSIGSDNETGREAEASLDTDQKVGGEPKRDLIAGLAGEYFEGFTLRETLGYWRGEPEESTQLEILIPNNAPEYANNALKNLIADLNKELDQDCILHEKQRVEAGFDPRRTKV